MAFLARCEGGTFELVGNEYHRFNVIKFSLNGAFLQMSSTLMDLGKQHDQHISSDRASNLPFLIYFDPPYPSLPCRGQCIQGSTYVGSVSGGIW